MYNNRLIYSSLQGSDPAFYSKILFAINEALQIHWCSCCNTEDRLSVNDKVLLMQDQQDMLLCHNFVQQLPKSIKDKIIKPKEDKKVPGKLLGQWFGLQKEKDKNQQKDIVVDNNKSHLCWRVKDAEN